MAVRSRFAEFLSRPVGWPVALTLAVLICLIPAGLLAQPLRSFRLRIDDFHYLAASRTWSQTVANLWEPHNFHVVPFFRIWTWLVVSAAGRWEHVQFAAAAAAYAALVLVMAVGGRFVAREARDGALGLAAMIALGVSSICYTAVIWYSASQTLWAGVGILTTFWALQSWRNGGRPWWLAAAAAAGAVAVASWSGGYTVGPSAAAYLWADGRWSCRRMALAILAITALVAAGFVAVKGRTVLAPRNFADRPPAEAIRPGPGAVHTLHAIGETLLLGNLGVECETTALQGVVLCLAIVVVWLWTRLRAAPITPLESAGATLLAISFCLVYTVRGYDPFSSLRTLQWYHTLPQIGAALFAAGWWSARPTVPPGPRPLTWGGTLAVVGFAAGMAAAHLPTAENRLLGDVYRLSPTEAKLFVTRPLEWGRAVGLASERAEHQRRFLKRLDEIERISRQMGIGRDAITQVFGRIEGPGLAESLDGAELLDLPREGREQRPEPIRRALGWLVVPEPLARPSWLDPDEPWPPP